MASDNLFNKRPYPKTKEKLQTTNYTVFYEKKSNPTSSQGENSGFNSPATPNLQNIEDSKDINVNKQSFKEEKKAYKEEFKQEYKKED